MSPSEQALWSLSPELILLLVGGILLGLDTLRSHWDASRWTPCVALAGLVGALAASGTLWGCNEPLLAVLSCDNFALAVNVITLATMVLVVLISGEETHARGEGHSGAFYALFLLAASSICLLGAVTDLVAFVLASELFGIAAYLLLSYHSGDRRASEAALKYFLYSAVASAMVLYGLSWFCGLAGSTALSAIAAALSEGGAAWRPVLLPALALMTVGFAFKVAAVPFHQWAPDVYEGTPESAVPFLATAPTIAGVAALARVSSVMLPPAVGSLSVDWRTLLMTLAVLAIGVGNLVALWQRDIRRFLAYFSLAQVGCLLVGMIAASPQGLVALSFALAAHLLGIQGVLAAVLALSRHTGSYAIEGYTGMHRRSPELAWPLLLCLLSLVGVPPLAGFVGRLYLLSAAIEAGLLWLAVVGVVGSVISLASVWRIARVLFVAPSMASPAQAEERLAVPPVLAVVLGMAVAGVFAMAVFANPILTLLQTAAQALFG